MKKSMIASSTATLSNLKENEFIVAGVYRLKKKIGSGSFGEIYVAVHMLTKEEFAVKLEHTHVSVLGFNINSIFFKINWICSKRALVSNFIKF